MHARHRDFHLTAALLSGTLALTALLWGAPQASAAEATADPMTEFDIALDGDRLGEEGDDFGGPVTVTVQLKSNNPDYALWIDDEGVWKLVSPQGGGYQKYTLTFAEEGDYDFELRVENKTTLDKSVSNVRFTVATTLGGVIDGIDALPDPADAPDSEITAKKADIVFLLNDLNSLPEEQRESIADYKIEKLTALQTKLAALDASTDISTPPAATGALKGDSFVEYGGLQYYRGAVTLSVSTGSNAAVVSDGGDFAPMEGKTAAYADPGKYHIRVCSESASKMRGPAVSFDFVVDPDVPDFIEEVDRLYTTAQSIDQNEYVTALEHLYKKYLEMPAARQALLPTRVRDRMIYMHDFILEQLKIQNVATDKDGRYIMAVGMYAALDIPAIHLASDEVSLVAERNAASPLPEGVQGTPLAEYDISFACPGMEGADLTIKPSEPVRIGIQVPEDLKGKKNVDILHIQDGKAASMGARVRSTDDNLVIYFNTTQTGRFVFVADADQKATQ